MKKKHYETKQESDQADNEIESQEILDKNQSVKMEDHSLQVNIVKTSESDKKFSLEKKEENDHDFNQNGTGENPIHSELPTSSMKNYPIHMTVGLTTVEATKSIIKEICVSHF